MTKSEEINKILHKHIRVVFKDAVNYKSLIEDILKWNETAKETEDLKHLEFIYNRLINVHKENPNTDYMIRLKSIINKSNTKL